MSADGVEAITHMVYAPWAGCLPKAGHPWTGCPPHGPPGLADSPGSAGRPPGVRHPSPGLAPLGWSPPQAAPLRWPLSLTTLLTT